MSDRAKFTILIPFLGALTALGPLSNDLYVPSLPLVASGLGVTGASVQLTMSSLLLGFALGCLIYGPLSDRHGRKLVLSLGLGIYVISGVLSALSSDLSALVACRFVQGVGASSGMVLARAIILDRWTGEQASRALSWVVMITFLTPVIAPLIGGYVASLGYWPTVFWLQAGAGAACLLALTKLPRVHRRRPMTPTRPLAAYATILTDRQTLGYLACVGFAFVGLIAFVSNSAFVFTEYFELQPYQYGYCFSFVMAGGSAGAYTNSRLISRHGISKMIGLGTVILASGGTAALLVSATNAGLVATLLSLLLYVYGIGFVFANSMARTMSRFRDMSGAASALFGVNQFLIGSFVAAALSFVTTPTPMPLASTMAFAGIGAAAVWWGWLRRAASASQ
ncbi:multidrug effflux MFS transporter [Candidatus Rariloculus sp.]|uniref:multidrug effflux MFS transporter n=1 Tax=Candidatus Rariloculus sp. TaxID=3101265 RepID=UPI003D107FF3